MVIWLFGLAGVVVLQWLDLGSNIHNEELREKVGCHMTIT